MKKFRIQRALCRRSVSSSGRAFYLWREREYRRLPRESLRFLINRRRGPRPCSFFHRRRNGINEMGSVNRNVVFSRGILSSLL